MASQFVEELVTLCYTAEFTEIRLNSKRICMQQLLILRILYSILTGPIYKI